MTIQIVEDDRALSDGIMLALKEPGLEFIQDVTVKAAAESFTMKHNLPGSQKSADYPHQT